MKRTGRNYGSSDSKPRSRRKMTDIEKENHRKKNMAATSKAKASFLQSMRVMNVANEDESSQNDMTSNNQSPSENTGNECNNYGTISNNQHPYENE